MTKKSSEKARRLEALDRAQQINQMLETSTIESEALMSAAGDSRPVNESHVLDLLEQKKAEAAGITKKSRPRKAARKQAKHRRR
jgi:hypothetical protein